MAAATVFNAAVTNPGGTGTSITVALSTHAVGDILEIQVTNTGNTLWASNPTGWSRNDQRTVGTASTGIVHTWLWREVVSGDTLPLANPVCNLGATVTRSAVCRTLRGADRGAIFTSTEWQRGFSTGTSNPVNPPTIVTPAPESLILHGYGQRTATNAPEPSGYTQDQEVIISGTIVLNASSKTVAAQNTSLSSQTASPTSGVRWAAGIMSIPSPDYPYYRSLSSTSATSVTQITGTLPTGTTASDVYGRADWIIAIVKATGSGISITAQDGSAWTDLMFETTSNNSDTIKVFACKYAVGRNLQFNRSTSGNIALRLITYRNCQQTDAIGNFHIKQNAGTPASWNAQDRAEAKSTVVAFIVADADTNNVHTPPAGWVERGDSLGIGCADQTFDAAGSTASANWTTTNAANVAGLVEIISHTVTAGNDYVMSTTTGTFTLTGTATGLTEQKKLTAAQATFTETGNAANLIRGRKVAAVTASFTLTGNASNFPRTRVMPATVGTFTEAGNAANLLFNQKLTAATGSFTVVGNDAFLNRGRFILAGTGSFSLTGNVSSLTVHKKLAADQASFTLTGNAATFLKGRTMPAESAVFSITGNDAGFAWTHQLVTSVGSFALTGQAANLLQGYTVSTTAGAFNLAGQAANFLLGRVLSATSGSFTFTGNDATLSKSAALTLLADTGVFVLNGNVATLTKTSALTLTTTVGSFALTGNTVELRLSQVLAAESAAFSLTGNSTGVTHGRLLTVESGSFVLTGNTANFSLTRTISVSTGVFSLTGSDTAFGGSRTMLASQGVFVLTGPDVALLLGTAATPIVGPLNVSLTNSGNLGTSISLGNLATASSTVSDGKTEVDV